MSGFARAVGAGILAGGLHALALRHPSAWIVAWVALVPLLVTVERASARLGFAATLAYAITLFEIDVTSWSAPAGARYFQMDAGRAWLYFGAGIGAGSIAYGTLLATAFWLRRRAGRALTVVWCAALWGVWDIVRAFVPPFLPASVLGTSQRGALPVLQLASVTGIAGVTALVVAGNVALAGLWSRPRRLAPLGTVAALVTAVVIWGGVRLERTTLPGPRVVLVDGDAASVAESTLERYIAATPPVDEPRAALVVWPESALTVDLAQDPAAWHRLSRFVADLGTPLVTGGIGSGIDDDGQLVRFNSVHFIRPRHGMRSYHKLLPIPIAESWPAMLGTPPAVLDPVAPGTEVVVFDDGGTTTFGPLICFEITHAGTARLLAARGVRFLVNVSNDAWFGDGEPPHWMWTPVRAVETGRSVARASNRGISAIIDPFGRVIAAARATDGPVVLAGTIPEPVDTIYVRTGEVFLPVCLLVVLVGLLPRRRPLTARGSMGP